MVLPVKSSLVSSIDSLSKKKENINSTFNLILLFDLTYYGLSIDLTRVDEN